MGALSFFKVSFIWRSLKPVDYLLLGYLLITFPLLFIAPSVEKVVWLSVVLRFILFPLVILGRVYFAYVPEEFIPEWDTGMSIRGRKIVLKFKYLFFVLDWLPMLITIYLYNEQGKILENLYSADFEDDAIKKIDCDMFGCNITVGIGAELRGDNPNRSLGEYLHFCYIFFFAEIFISFFCIYFWRPREHFDRLSTTAVFTYMACYAVYFFLPVEGPFWAYDKADPDQVGYFFSKLVHDTLKAGSSLGTATPSSHCAISVCIWVVTMLYHWPLAVTWIAIVPGLVFATIWCGFHYAFDSIIGVALGIVGAGIGVWVTAHVRYIPPISDWQYSKRPGMLPLSNVEAAPLLSPIADSQKTQGPYYVINSP
eukprot:Colp12_sorted_trinity150504_noHs@29740